MGILIPLILISFTCLLIWRACDGFEIASEYIGRNMSEGVRGGTINAISSSIPELCTTLIALFVLSDRDGFAIGIGTTAGSAMFNGMIIPAACIMTVVGTVIMGVRVASVHVSTKVLLRDGLSLIFCEFILILLINGQKLHWWQGLVLIALYAAYFGFMLLSMQRRSMQPSDALTNDDALANSDALPNEHAHEQVEEPEIESRGILGGLVYWLSLGPLMDLESMFIGDKQREQITKETWNGWPLLLTSTAMIGISCWMLVKACEWLGTGSVEAPHYTLFGNQLTGMGMPPMFVAVIFASMATSVPDLVMSIRDARDGDYDDAVANALGSNIFDICFALGFPLFLFTLINGPIEMPAEIAAESGELRLLLLGLTIVSFFIYFIGRRGVTGNGVTYVRMGRGKALLLLALYLVFVSYIVARSRGSIAAEALSVQLQSLLQWLPAFG
ncbi:sodium:calcium antiporter [Allorhodopirellula solitaria]|uniref:Putative calcium/sodium:proton antiporter n=1 Tax=Allorhodopirellula solitaria TaxID=2527987 RepID=A0A5C5WZ56_9BACT|nr:sodium:calcium antiporter [Allorhodopirellula solitaria]TWT55926.1 putative calcium/sodium:proton antiporter [Allorhodopirellula solitaria]